jgi:hypothetical protein
MHWETKAIQPQPVQWLPNWSLKRLGTEYQKASNAQLLNQCIGTGRYEKQKHERRYQSLPLPAQVMHTRTHLAQPPNSQRVAIPTTINGQLVNPKATQARQQTGKSQSQHNPCRSNLAPNGCQRRQGVFRQPAAAYSTPVVCVCFGRPRPLTPHPSGYRFRGYCVHPCLCTAPGLSVFCSFGQAAGTD